MAKIIVVGYGEMFQSIIDGAIEGGHKVVGVLRNDRRIYDGLELFLKDLFTPSLEKNLIKYRKLNEIKADSVNSEEFKNAIKKLKPDLIVVGSWGEKLKPEILNTIKCINFHPALLPKNRGANPYFWSIYLNQSISGLTIHFMDEKFDCGDIILQEAITISENETGASLKAKTTKLAKTMIKEVLELFDKKQIQAIKQDEKYATYEKQISLKEMVVDLTKPKEEVSRHLRALYPWAIPFLKIKGRLIKIGKYEFLKNDEKYKNKKPYDFIEKNKNFILIKGSDFLFKMYKN